jgi:hypothetical protein
MKGGEEMKKILIGVMVLSILLVTAAAFARPWGGPAGKTKGISAEQQKFFDETLELRKEMHDIRFELREAYRAPNPDEQKIAALENEIVIIREQIRSKADEFGVEKDFGYGSKCGVNASGFCCNESETGNCYQNRPRGGCGMMQGRI